MTIALLVSTYNWPQALSRVLESVLLQSRLPDEILIADDGSKEDTKQVIDEFKNKTAIPVKHIWHEDKGFRKTTILNKTIAKCESDYIIQIDGDIILTAKFIADHIRLCKRKHVITGSRASLTKSFTTQLLHSTEPIDFKQLKKNTPYKLNSLRLPFLSRFLSTRYKTKGKYYYFSKGCNMSFWKDDLLKINGFNEDLYEWGYEDSELIARLLKAGVKKLFIKFSAIEYHLWHPVSSMQRKSINFDIYQNTIDSSDYWTANGLNKHFT